MGLGASDLSLLVCVHLTGLSTVEFIAKDGSGQSVSALSQDLTQMREYEIIWQTESVQLYIDRVLVATITTHIPTSDLPVLFAGQKI